MTAAHDQPAQPQPGMDEESSLRAGLEDLVGHELLGRYRLDELLSVGGTGAVYKGHQITLKRDVAVKILHPELTRSERVFKRFRREGESTARLEHPNIVQVLEAGSTDDGHHFIVMQLLDGVELHERLGAPFQPRVAAELMLQLFSGLEHAHQRGVVHRDLKPENVFLTRDHENRETVKLVDFGLAKLLEGAHDGEMLTRLGMVFGTPAYMSPEQAGGREVDHRTDLYSAGLIFYGMLAGRPPFIEDDAVALMRAQVKQMPPPLPDEVPGELATLVFELLAKEPAERPADAAAVRARLETILSRFEDEPARRGAPLWWLRVAGVAAIAAALSLAVVSMSGADEGADAAAPGATDDVARAPAPESTEPVSTEPVSTEPVPVPVPVPAPDLEPTEPVSEQETTPDKRASSAKKSDRRSRSKHEKKKKKGFWLGEARRPGQG